MTPSPKQHPELLSCNFNQDFSCIAVGTQHGYSIINCDPFGKIYTQPTSAIAIAEMLFCTSLVALVGSGSTPNSSPRTLQIVNTKRQSTICELRFPTAILAVRMNRKRLVVVLEKEIYIYDISTMKLLHTLDTGVNPNAICALSPSNDASYLAYPAPSSSSDPSLSTSQPPSTTSSNATGAILIFDTISLTAVNIIQAHKSAVAALAINCQGTMLATASDTGTVIRVFSLPDARKLGEYRRGTKSAKVYSMNFNPAGTMLAVSSDTDTVHIFNLLEGNDRNGNKGTGRGSSEDMNSPVSPTVASDPYGNGNRSPTVTPVDGGADGKPANRSSLSTRSLHLGKNLASFSSSYLPKGVTDIWEPKRDFAHLKLRGAGGKCVVAMSGVSPHVMVITSTGLFQAYVIDLEAGGECQLVKEYPLITNDLDSLG